MRYLNIVIIILISSFTLYGGERVTKKEIPVADLNLKYNLIGTLGHPLGKLIHLDVAVVDSKQKGDFMLLSVTKINDKTLKTPLEIQYQLFRWNGLKALKKGGKYQLRGYEDGGMVGIPDAAMRESIYVQSRSYHFMTHFVVIKASAIK